MKTTLSIILPVLNEAACVGGTLRALAALREFKLGIVHGDAQSLAGWGFAQEHLREAARTGRRSGAGSSARRSTPSRAPIPACPCSRGCVRRVGRRVAGS